MLHFVKLERDAGLEHESFATHADFKEESFNNPTLILSQLKERVL